MTVLFCHSFADKNRLLKLSLSAPKLGAVFLSDVATAFVSGLINGFATSNNVEKRTLPLELPFVFVLQISIVALMAKYNFQDALSVFWQFCSRF